MRKHFLILMLLTLLPFSAWAETLTEDMFTVESPFYGNLPTVTATIAATNYDYGYYSDANAATEVTEAYVEAANASTTLYVKFTGKNGYEGTVTKSFVIKKMPLTIHVTDVTKTFGEAAATSFTFTAVDTTTAHTAAPAAVKNAIVVAKEDPTNNNVKYAGTPATVAGYGFTATLTHTNYEIGKVFGTYKINPKTIAGVTIADIAAVTYKGSAWTPTPQVKDGSTTLTAGTDFTFSYENNTNAALSTAASAPTVTVTGKGNYDSATSANKKFTINAAPLFVIPTATKVYNATAGIPAVPTNANAKTAQTIKNDSVTFTFQGFVDTKNAQNVTVNSATATTEVPALAWKGTANANVGNNYAIQFSNADINKCFALANYSFIALEGTYSITQKNVSAVADDKEINYGDEEVFALKAIGTTSLTEAANNDDKAALTDAIKIVKGEKITTGAKAGKYPLTPSYRTDAEIEEYINAKTGLTADQKTAAIAAAKTAIANYTLNAGAGQAAASVGYLTINPAPLYIGLKESAYTLNKVYDGQNVQFTLNTTDGLTIVGKKGSDVINVSNLDFEVENNDSKVGLYTIRLSGADADNPNYAITYIPSQFEITKKTLKVTVYDQTFVTNATIPTNLNNLYKIDPTDGLVSTDQASQVFKLALVNGVTTAKYHSTADYDTDAFSANKFVAVPQDADATHNVGWAGGIYAGGIDAVDAGTTASKWGNYNVQVTKGKVTVVADGASTFVLDDNKNLTTILTANTNNATVTFTSRPLYAETWNAMVLPFEIAVKDLAAAFDYAVVDVLDQNATDGNVHFRLKVSGNIAANTPFLIYPCGTYNNLNQVIFTNVSVKKVTTATVPVADGGGNKFIGVYNATPIHGSDKLRYLGSDGKFYGTTKYTSESPAIIKPLRAYLDLTGSSAAAPVIYVEEPDGSTTAISTINADGVAVPAQGWYTINGMKLEGMPTEKGIYINNGKKVVIK